MRGAVAGDDGKQKAAEEDLGPNDHQRNGRQHAAYFVKRATVHTDPTASNRRCPGEAHGNQGKAQEYPAMKMGMHEQSPRPMVGTAIAFSY